MCRWTISAAERRISRTIPAHTGAEARLNRVPIRASATPSTLHRDGRRPSLATTTLSSAWRPTSRQSVCRWVSMPPM